MRQEIKQMKRRKYTHLTSKRNRLRCPRNRGLDLRKETTGTKVEPGEAESDDSDGDLDNEGTDLDDEVGDDNEQVELTDMSEVDLEISRQVGEAKLYWL